MLGRWRYAPPQSVSEPSGGVCGRGVGLVPVVFRLAFRERQINGGRAVLPRFLPRIVIWVLLLVDVDAHDCGEQGAGRNNDPVVTVAIMLVCIALWIVELLLSFLAPQLLNGLLQFGMFQPASAFREPWTFITSMFLHEPRSIFHILFNMLTLWAVGPFLLQFGMFQPASAFREPWTFITSMFLHEPRSIFHILFNMLTLWAVGPFLERLMGHWAYLVLYAVSGIGGGMGMMVWAALSGNQFNWLTASYGASGALFGLFAACLVVYRKVGEDLRSMLIWMGINFLMPLITPNIAWQAHLGGFVVGGATTTPW